MGKKITIPFLEGELDELKEGKIFNWCFDGVNVELKLDNENG